jgi:cob(I)alamin adenosyltransferase
VRITKVYTKSGDGGETSLVSGDRVSKADLRVAAYGEVDELNSLLGLARTALEDEQVDAALGRVQNELFVLGADLASPLSIAVPRVEGTLIAEMEQEIDLFLAELEPLKEFILPGGSQTGALLHLARTVARRAERTAVALAAREGINPQAVCYLNRLSDFLFVLARVVNRRAGMIEQPARFSQRGKREAGTPPGGA